MSDIAALASSAMAMSQSNLQQQMQVSMLKKSAQADQEVSDMIIKNARRVAELSQQEAGRIDIYA